MALTQSEKQKRYRARLKLKQQQERKKPAPKDAAARYYKTPFSEFLKGRSTTFEENLDWAGVSVLGSLEDEDHPLSRADEWNEQGIVINSLNRASAMVDVLIDAAKELAALLNEYKLAELDRYKPRSTADAEMVEIYRQDLKRRTSHFFQPTNTRLAQPEYEIKGD